MDTVNKNVQLRFTDSRLDWCEGRLPTADGPVTLRWRKDGGKLVYQVTPGRLHGEGGKPQRPASRPSTLGEVAALIAEHPSTVRGSLLPRVDGESAFPSYSFILLECG